MAEKEAAQKAEAEKIAEAKEEETKKIENDIVNTEPVVEKIESTTEVSNTESESKSESKGLNDILMFFVKIFGMMLVGVIILMIAIKVLFGKKASADS